MGTETLLTVLQYQPQQLLRRAQVMKGDRKLHLSAVQLNRNDMKVDVWTLGEVKAENMSADSGFLVVRISEFDLKEVGKKSSTKAKISL